MVRDAEIHSYQVQICTCTCTCTSASTTGATIIQFKYTCAMMTNSMSTKRSDDGAGWCEASGMPPGLHDAFGKSYLYLLKEITFPSAPVSTLNKSGFLE